MPDKKSVTPRFTTAVIILLCFIGLAAFSIYKLSRYEQQRDLNNWRITLGVMADSRANGVNRWIDQQFTVLQELADNGSLRMYTQQILRQPEQNRDGDAAQISYLGNLIHSTAERNGFTDKKQPSPRIKANIAFHANNHLSLLGKNAKIIVSTAGVTEPDSRLRRAVDDVLKNGKRRIYDLFLNENNHAAVGFLVPVFGLQQSGDSRKPVAALFGVKNANPHLFPLLASSSTTTDSDETLLVKKDGELIVYLSPLADGTPPLKRSLAADVANLAGASSVAHPGRFDRSRDYSGTSVLFTSRRLADLPWTLVQKINIDEALNESRSHQRFLFSSLLLALFLVLSLMVAAWWHGCALRERQTVHDLRRKSHQLEAQTNLLNAINDNITDFILLIDNEFRLIFANRSLTGLLQIDPDEIKGKTLNSVLGTETAKLLKKNSREATDQGNPAFQELNLEINGRLFLFSAAFIPVAYQKPARGTILINLHDITALQETRRKQERLMSQIVTSLMRAIDLHDPYSAGHSAKTASIATAIGRAMDVDDRTLATIGIAANLCNLGKLSIPRDVLTKKEKLTSDEQNLIQEESRYATDILAKIDFDGPVLDTILQKQEFLDGSGYPAGLKETGIILPARILATANSFVAMISPRAYRERLEIDEALNQLLQDAGKKYDRHVVAAMFHVAENIIDFEKL